MIDSRGKRVVILMIDGFGMDYYEKTELPVMRKLAKDGVFKKGKCVFPSLTNANNISIACGSWPEVHGVTTNCYFDELTGKAEFLEDASFLCTATIFDRAKEHGIRSALLTCKSKTTKILGNGVELAIAAEEPTGDLIEKYGHPPPMYSSEINYWLCEVALDILSKQPEIGLVYLHTTDYPMHMWPAEASESKEHLLNLDGYLKKFCETASDATFLITADHGMNYKKQCWDLAKACGNRGFPLKFAVSPVADRLLKHHRGFGGVSYVYLNDKNETDKAMSGILSLKGVEEVLDRKAAAARFKLMASRIGDLVVVSDIDTVFGDLPEEIEILEATYRSHGSLYEMDIPLLIFSPFGKYPDPQELQFNFDLTKWLF